MAASSMPTAARLVAAAALGCGAAVMVLLLIAYYPDERFDREQSDLLKVFFAVGALVGWFSLGKRAASEEGTGIFLGLRAGITVAVSLLFILAIYHVVGDILDSRLAGARPMEAIWAVFEKAFEYSIFMLHAKFLGIAAFVSVTIGVLVKNTHRRWR